MAVNDHSMRVPGARAGFTAVTPYLMAPDVEPVIAFAKRVFDAEETLRVPGGAGGIHCEIRVGDSMLMLGGGSGIHNPVISPRLVGLQVYVPDVDARYQRAIDAGGRDLSSPADQPHGERAGVVADPAGNQWYIATRLDQTTGTEAARTVTPQLYVQRTTERGAPEFIAFLEAAFGATTEERHESPDGLVAFAVVSLRGAALGIGEGPEPGLRAPASFYLYVDDCDALYAQAVRAGARDTHPPADQPHGDRMGTVEDAWGNEWFVATHKNA